MFRFISISIMESSSSGQYGCWFWLNNNCSFELSNKFSIFLSENWVSHHKIMFKAFLDTNFSSSNIGESSNTEWESWELLINDWEEFSSTFTLKTVLLIHFSFVDGSSKFSFFTKTFSWWDENIKTNNITSSEFPIFNSLFWGRNINDNFITVN